MTHRTKKRWLVNIRGREAERLSGGDYASTSHIEEQRIRHNRATRNQSSAVSERYLAKGERRSFAAMTRRTCVYAEGIVKLIIRLLIRTGFEMNKDAL